MSEELAWATYESPIGKLTVVAGPRGIVRLSLPGHASRLPVEAERAMPEASAQLDQYFAGERRAFELALELRGAPLRRQVWERLLEIPYGETVGYGELARRIDEVLYEPGLQPHERPRAIGSVLACNPIAILVPCHRVIGADGSLVGYGGGLERKRMLLELERAEAVASSAKAEQLTLL